MQKIFKRVAILLAVMISVVCLGISLTACSDTGYNITVVYSDGTAVDGTQDGYNDLDPDDKTVEVQICVVLANGETGSCFDSKKLDANGKATLTAPDYTLKDGEKFKIQVNNVPKNSKVTSEYPRTYHGSEYVTKPGSYTVKLEAAN